MIRTIKNNIKNCDKVLLTLTLIMFIFGLLNIVTASSREAVVRYDASLYHYFYRQLLILLFAFTSSIIIICLNTREYQKMVKIGFAVIIFLCGYLLVSGTSIKGAANWIEIPIIGQFQPSELAKLIIIMTLAVVFEKYHNIFQNKEAKRYDKIAIVLAVGIVIPFIVFLQKDFGTAFIIFTIFFVLFLSSPILKKDKIKTIILIIMIFIIGGIGRYLMSGYIFTSAQMSRFDFTNPCQKYENSGYQICNGYIAINNGGLKGLGISKSKQIYSYIPEPHTDSVFAIIAEENGVLICACIFLVFTIILWRIIKISSESYTKRGRYIGLGVATYIFLHLFLNLGGLFGLIPLTGVPLPFFSYGGSFCVTLVWSLAVVQRINIETQIKNQKNINKNA